MSYVFNPDGTYREVTNLGWLLRHSSEVERVEAHGGNVVAFMLDGSEWSSRKELTRIPDESVGGARDSLMIARLRDGRVYVTRWASYEVMSDWLSRPRFKGLPLRWFGRETTC